MPDPAKIAEIREPIVTVTIFVPQEYVGTVMTLCTGKRGVQINMAYHGRQVHLTYELPLAEIVLDFFDRLKSASRGYASMDYEFREYRAADVVKVDILINGERVDALSVIVPVPIRPIAGATWRPRCVSSYRARCSTSPSRRRSAPISSRART